MTRLIGNESNLNAKWPFDSSNNRLNYLPPQDCATCFRKVYNAIKSIRPNDEVMPQAPNSKPSCIGFGNWIKPPSTCFLRWGGGNWGRSLSVVLRVALPYFLGLHQRSI